MDEGTMTPAETLARNVRARRSWHGMQQSELAARMVELGHPWRDTTVSQVEAGRRKVEVNELCALALALRTTPPELLTPPGARYVDLGHASGVPIVLYRAWLRGDAVVTRDGGIAAHGPDDTEPQRGENR